MVVMDNRFVSDSELLRFCFWTKNVFRNDLSVNGFSGSVFIFFGVNGRKTDILIKRIISLGYAKKEDGVIKVLV